MTRQDARKAIYDAINMPGLLSPAASDFYFMLADRICLGQTKRSDALRAAWYSALFGRKCPELRAVPGHLKSGQWERCSGTEACINCRFRCQEDDSEGSDDID